MQPNESDLLQQQQRYYSERAPEYDEWWERRGRYDRGEENNRIWFEEVAAVHAVMDAVDWTGDVLELAGGTGNATVRLAPHAARLTVIDGSEEMLAINRKRLKEAGLDERVEYVQADLFRWRPDRTYDAAFCGFFLSHVPRERLDSLLDCVAAAVRDGGRLVIVDSQRQELSSSPDQPPPPEDSDIATRRLNDGRTYQIVKRYFQPAELEAKLQERGFEAQAGKTPLHFVYCTATRRGR